jgi:hypothetical protein
MTRAARANSCSLSFRISPRLRRLIPIQEPAASRKIRAPVPGWKRAAMAISNKSGGKARKASTVRISRPSIQGQPRAAADPTATPSTREIAAASNPMTREIRPPQSIRDQRSRPNLSLPRK